MTEPWMRFPPGQPVTSGDRFSFEAVTNSRDPRYWDAGWKLFREQAALIVRITGVERRRGREHWQGTWTPLLDLQLQPGASGSSLVNANVAWLAMAPADPTSSAPVLAAGTPLVWVSDHYDNRYHEGVGITAFKAPIGTDGAIVRVGTALEGRWGCEAALMDALIVAAEAPVARDVELRARLLLDLRELTMEFRKEHNLPAGHKVRG